MEVEKKVHHRELQAGSRVEEVLGIKFLAKLISHRVQLMYQNTSNKAVNVYIIID
jgi:hypothetical protein